MSNPIQVGIIGCGKISQAYFNGIGIFGNLQVAAVADLNPEVARAKAAENNTRAVALDELLADPAIEIVLNLTVPRAHAEVDLRILDAGKHVYSEKPLATTLEEGTRVIAAARDKGLRVGCAPDTFLGAGLQTCRKLVDDGWIGRPVAGTAFMLSHGPESWHPNPGFYYQTGGGPLLDMGPYYLTALIHLLGPVHSVMAMTRRTFPERLATCQEHFGERLPVEVNTHAAGTLAFHSGAIITLVMSFDVWKHQHSRIELYGTEGSLAVPDPNTFGGEVQVFRPGYADWAAMGYSHIYHENTRGIGVADLADALRADRPHRCHGDLALHVLEIMTAFDESSAAGRQVTMKTTCAQPAPLPLGLIKGRIERDGHQPG
ncbi:MAG: Gfo/Idh/MocA family oxidoreductase [Candidatus Marinimicrobia bacterium]|nr:Gfo/Idh/MocA family oxidoreductase [Candidatus Neomarinimicrobiota bacterium]